MQTVKRLTIAVIGMTDTVTSEIRMAWFHAQIGLEGPYSASFIESKGALKFAAAIIDVRYEADVMLRLTDQLDGEAIPYLFFVPETVIDSEPGPFALSGRSEDIENIVSALMAQGGGIRH
ncbi:hypothetical protein G6L26_025885 (plasmid) [Agrobacterium radiobacter]|uniref:Uncharacterized protein n=1 Tax=Agrobacterium tumefaciens str. B6 TaxID=1183423 RepID=A0A822VA76_AGRTU|nr:hypothetical protein [Agrobacterium tumefaciens]KWT81356.1 hypothetical protein ASB65_16650 [Agrobacterium tumefaciens str. B6]NTA05914.1 hypothetical protein [Agrobacterium tumefaciens]NTA94911.1 hypothetical protein [Agrobacterium tumefaciens]NTB13560.1 hypothetical protein [Agrobacterium tumefaciens]OCJ39468.1 hypothetical protein A6U90_19305 [Agrobacterium tumefaciens]